MTMNPIKEYRKRHGLSQKSLAKKLGVTQGLVSHLEVGRQKITANRAVEIEIATNGELRFDQLWTRAQSIEKSP